jgi:hypothetical protein
MFRVILTLVEISQNVTTPFTDYMRLVVVCDWIWEHLQLQNQISTILVILTTMMQLLKFSSY